MICIMLNKKVKIAFMKSTVLPNTEIHASPEFEVQDSRESHYQMLPQWKVVFSQKLMMLCSVTTELSCPQASVRSKS